jgi:hypothetical protein
MLVKSEPVQAGCGCGGGMQRPRYLGRTEPNRPTEPDQETEPGSHHWVLTHSKFLLPPM